MPSLQLSPIDFHSHGVGKLDFMHVGELELDRIEESLACEGIRSILTLYLPFNQFDAFLRLMRIFGAEKRAGRYRHIVGFGLEGPLLASHGGTPEQGVWRPTKRQWRQLAACGRDGLEYIIFSPDATLHGGDSPDEEPRSLAELIGILMDGGVRPAPGHFCKDRESEGVRGLETLFDLLVKARGGPTVTDHLFNDMPLNFTHAWRTTEARLRRDHELEALDLPGWSLSNLNARLGPVPALMIEGARQGLVKLCMNFDGDHVDLAISKRTVEVVGAEHFLLMTDRIQGQVLAGRRLTKSNDNTLLYQHKGIVAGGSQFVAQQIYNMRYVGIPESSIQLIAAINPASVLGLPAGLQEAGVQA